MWLIGTTYGTYDLTNKEIAEMIKLSSVVWRLSSGVCRLASGVCRLASGVCV
jgi:hypothetical protein